ncbi:hypothetical protein Cgig2_004201 [Carnegiea gigantea]|uniref:RNase H type-1 domain-containing protein n=1 Tax=Carnegiea gigantea TaxID=171969 RepID=A0A9Q1QPN2_9CARY|nr:hypothetical protein Cgig2_004201 [Carnegiea gigantea]
MQLLSLRFPLFSLWFLQFTPPYPHGILLSAFSMQGNSQKVIVESAGNGPWSFLCEDWDDSICRHTLEWSMDTPQILDCEFLFITNWKDVFVNCSQLLLVGITRAAKLPNLGWNGEKSCYSSLLEIVTFSWIRRSGNEAAHRIAKWSIAQERSCVWDGDPPLG